jgi:hypothetical protein
VPNFDERTTALLEELKQALSEIDRLTARARSIMDELDGTKSSQIEMRVAQAIAALRAKSRAKRAAAR